MQEPLKLFSQLLTRHVIFYWTQWRRGCDRSDETVFADCWCCGWIKCFFIWQKMQKMCWHRSELKSHCILDFHCNNPPFHNTYVSRKKRNIVWNIWDFLCIMAQCTENRDQKCIQGMWWVTKFIKINVQRKNVRSAGGTKCYATKAAWQKGWFHYDRVHSDLGRRNTPTDESVPAPNGLHVHKAKCRIKWVRSILQMKHRHWPKWWKSRPSQHHKVTLLVT